jgi:murein DD-endopeptidase MepM/ murein hydrolase activator NlpD
MMILSDIIGTVTKLGYPYADALEYRYVQITDSEGYDVRYFYVDPIVKVGDEVNDDTIIGVAQDLHVKFDENMTQHVHLEVKRDGKYIDPREYLDKIASQ